MHGLPDRSTGIIAIATEPGGRVHLRDLCPCSTRLIGLTWGAEDLSAEIGALETRSGDGAWTEPFRFVRSLCLFGAAPRGGGDRYRLYGFPRRSRAPAGMRRSRPRRVYGQAGHPPLPGAAINEAFTPGAGAVAHAERVIAAMRATDGSGVASLDGKMLDRLISKPPSGCWRAPAVGGKKLAVSSLPSLFRGHRSSAESRLAAS
jgi:citrate lyase subunit beta/citryl-CoA lyase